MNKLGLTTAALAGLVLGAIAPKTNSSDKRLRLADIEDYVILDKFGFILCLDQGKVTWHLASDLARHIPSDCSVITVERDSDELRQSLVALYRTLQYGEWCITPAAIDRWCYTQGDGEVKYLTMTEVGCLSRTISGLVLADGRPLITKIPSARPMELAYGYSDVVAIPYASYMLAKSMYEKQREKEASEEASRKAAAQAAFEAAVEEAVEARLFKRTISEDLRDLLKEEESKSENLSDFDKVAPISMALLEQDKEEEDEDEDDLW